MADVPAKDVFVIALLALGEQKRRGWLRESGIIRVTVESRATIGPLRRAEQLSVHERCLGSV